MPTNPKAASDYTDYVKKRASVVGRREFSDSLFNSLILQSSVGRGLGNTPEGPVVGGDYGVMTFTGNEYLGFPTVFLPQNFTVECFFRVSEFVEGQQKLWLFLDIDSEIWIGLYIEDGVLWFQDSISGRWVVEQVSIDTWYHCAVSRSGTTFYVSLNGTIVHTQNTDIDLSTSYLYAIGNSFQYIHPLLGSISNFRVSNTARYTTDFTVPTLPLQSDANTLLLLLAKSASTVGVDSSSYKRVAEGTCGWAPGPIEYLPISSYGVISGFSVTSYLTVPTADLGMSGNYTLECFVLIPDTELGLGFFATGGVDLGVYGGFIQWDINFVPKTNYVNKWTHIAIVSVSGLQHIYVDGIDYGSYSYSIGNSLAIGDDIDSPFDGGKISNFRVSNYARYTNNFIPTLPLTADTNTTLLLTDSLTNSVSGGATVTKLGTVTIAPEVIVYSRYA